MTSKETSRPIQSPQGTQGTQNTQGSEHNQASPGRRNFLGNMRGLGLLGAAALLASRGTAVQAAPLVEEAASEPATEGYHETERIRKYYATLRRM